MVEEQSDQIFLKQIKRDKTYHTSRHPALHDLWLNSKYVVLQIISGDEMTCWPESNKGAQGDGLVTSMGNKRYLHFGMEC